MVDIQSQKDELGEEKKKEERKKKPQGKNIMSASAMQGGHKKMSLKITLKISSVCYVSSVRW